MDQQWGKDNSEFKGSILGGNSGLLSCASKETKGDCTTGMKFAPSAPLDYEHILAGLLKPDENSAQSYSSIPNEENSDTKKMEKRNCEGKEVLTSESSLATPQKVEQMRTDHETDCDNDDWPVIKSCRGFTKGRRRLTPKKEIDKPDSIDLTDDDCMYGLNFHTNLTDVKPDIGILQKLISKTIESQTSVSTSSIDEKSNIPTQSGLCYSSQAYTPCGINTNSMMTQGVPATTKSTSTTSLDLSTSTPLPRPTFMSCAKILAFDPVSKPDCKAVKKAKRTLEAQSCKQLNNSCTFNQSVPTSATALDLTTTGQAHQSRVLPSPLQPPSLMSSHTLDLRTVSSANLIYRSPNIQSSVEVTQTQQLPTSYNMISDSFCSSSKTSTPVFNQSGLAETWKPNLDHLCNDSLMPVCLFPKEASSTALSTWEASTSVANKSNSFAGSTETQINAILSSESAYDCPSIPVAQSVSKTVDSNLTPLRAETSVDMISLTQENAQTGSHQIKNSALSSSQTFAVKTDTVSPSDNADTTAPVNTELLMHISNTNDAIQGETNILSTSNSLPSDISSNGAVAGTDEVTRTLTESANSDYSFPTYFSNTNSNLLSNISSTAAKATTGLPEHISQVTGRIPCESSKEYRSKSRNNMASNSRHIRSEVNRYLTSHPSASSNSLNDITSDLNDILVMINKNHTASSAEAHSLNPLPHLDASPNSTLVMAPSTDTSRDKPYPPIIKTKPSASENNFSRRLGVGLLPGNVAITTNSSTLLQHADRSDGPSGEGSCKSGNRTQCPKSSYIKRKGTLSHDESKAMHMKRSVDAYDANNQADHSTPKQGKMESMAYRKPPGWSKSPEKCTVSHGVSSSPFKSSSETMDSENMLLSCANCDTMQASGNCTHCKSGHMVCLSCLKEEVMNVMDSDVKLYLTCPTKSCGKAIMIDSFANLLDPLVVELLRKNILKKEQKLSTKTINKMAVSCPNCLFVNYLEEENLHFRCGARNCTVECCRYCKAVWNNTDGHECCLVLSFVGTECLRDISKAPISWEAQWFGNVGDENYTPIEVRLDSKMGMAVAAFFYQTSKNMSINRIWKIQNRKLWEKYVLKRKHLETEIGTPNIGEKALFHGTKQNIHNICKEGFDTRMPTINGTALGKGIYFSRFASYSKRFSDQVLFLTRVLCGWSTVGDQTFLRPPYHSSGRMFDCCVDNIISPSMYVVFDNCQCYPEFLIEYKSLLYER